MTSHGMLLDGMALGMGAKLGQDEKPATFRSHHHVLAQALEKCARADGDVVQCAKLVAQPLVMHVTATSVSRAFPEDNQKSSRF